MARDHAGSPPKAFHLESRRKRLTNVLLVSGLCVLSYMLGAWQSKTASVPMAGCDNAASSALDFEARHQVNTGGATTASNQRFPACPMNFSEYTPCQDTTRGRTFDRDMLVYRERHCPGKGEQIRCLIPAPPKYKSPFKWPQSRDFAWFANIPHKELSIEKAIQNWIQVEGDRFRFPGGGTGFPRVLPLLLAVEGYQIRAEEESGRESDIVRGLPGQPPVNFRQYAGYVKVGERKEKALFYWFFEAEQRAEAKPLVLWLNGGPGCSSVAYGAAQELGPFLVRGDGANLTRNAYSWNKVANLLFLESPVGVGFSYTNRSSDLQELGDRITAEDSHDFLLSWFNRFPGFKSHDFYIAGESYAGHYVPQLAGLIYDGNKAGGKGAYIKLKGFMIGNAVLNDETDQMGMVEYAWSHAIISDELYAAVTKDCNSFKEEDDRGGGSSTCSPVIKAFLQAYSDIDIYSIYSPVCLSSLDPTSKRKSKLIAAPRLFSQHELWHGIGWRLPSGYDPCTEDYVEKYFNREDVQRALHANISHLSYPYSPCSQVIDKWNDSPSTVLPILSKLLKAGIRIWVYSGDTDGRVPVTSTRFSINKMRLRVKKDKKNVTVKPGERTSWGGWKAWYHKRQVAGWSVEYEEGLTLATVRGAGHQVPVFAPDRSLSLFEHFLNGRSLPSARF